MKRSRSALIGLSMMGFTTMAVSSVAATCDLSVTDFRGAKLYFDRPVRRIVCLIESGLSGLYMLGAADAVVGVPASVYQGSVAASYAALDDRIRDRKLPAPGSWDFVNIETVVGLQPDLVIMWAAQKESIASLEAKDIPVYGVELATLEDVYREIADFGKLTATSARAAELIAFTQNELTSLKARLAADKRPPVKAYFMWAQGPLETAGRNSTVHALLELAGATNACPIPAEHVVTSLENVIAWQPKVIVMWCNAKLSPADVMAMDGWRALPAAQSRRIYEMPEAFFCDFWTLKFQYAVKITAKWCQPETFANMDLEQELRRTMKKLYGERAAMLVP